MNDRELLELAAKACGYQWRQDVADYRNERGIVGLWIVDPMKTGWNPLEDDGDALRLAVRLELDINFGMRGAVIERFREDIAEIDEKDPYAAARRAIVRAAAEFGKRMK